jgi:acetolactate synthase regulatory subunit
MKFTVQIRINNAEGALERVLGRLRQRTFSICTMFASRAADPNFMDIEMTIEGTRATEPILRQLAKLYDVQQVKVQHTESGNHGQWQYQVQGNTEVCVSV